MYRLFLQLVQWSTAVCNTPCTALHHNQSSSCAAAGALHCILTLFIIQRCCSHCLVARQYCGRREHCHANTGAHATPCSPTLHYRKYFFFFSFCISSNVVGSMHVLVYLLFFGTCVLMVAHYGTSKKTTFDAINLLQSIFYWSRAFTQSAFFAGRALFFFGTTAFWLRRMALARRMHRVRRSFL